MSYYNDISEGYEELHKEEQLKKLEIIKKFLKVKKDDKLLDVGCGSGISTEIWPCKIYGIDPSEKLIEIAKSKKGIYKIAKAEKIPFEDNYFDYVISVTAIQNFDDIKKGLKEIKRVGKGRFILTALRKSNKIQLIKELIYDIFNVEKEIKEDKDFIFIIYQKI